MATKLTKKEIVNMLLKEQFIQDNSVYMGYLKNELALLEKKSAGKKATATQKLNEGIKGTILKTLVEVGKPVTVTELQGASVDLSGYSNQKLSALLKQLVDTGKVQKTVEKKVSHFSA